MSICLVISNYDILKIYLSVIIWFLLVSDIIWQPRSSAGKIYMSFLWLTFLVVAATYTANLVATLATQKPKVPYKTLDEVAVDDEFTLLIWPHSIQRIVLEVLVVIFSREIDYFILHTMDGQNERNLSVWLYLNQIL